MVIAHRIFLGCTRSLLRSAAVCAAMEAHKASGGRPPTEDAAALPPERERAVRSQLHVIVWLLADGRVTEAMNVAAEGPWLQPETATTRSTGVEPER